MFNWKKNCDGSFRILRCDRCKKMQMRRYSFGVVGDVDGLCIIYIGDRRRAEAALQRRVGIKNPCTDALKRISVSSIVRRDPSLEPHN